MQYEAQTVPLWSIGRVSYGVFADGNNGALVKQRRGGLFLCELSDAAGRDVGDNLVSAVGERERIRLRQVKLGQKQKTWLYHVPVGLAGCCCARDVCD